jgi:multiple antibiotic resistance protein
MKEFWLAFVPLFVAIDALGTAPLFLSLTKSIPERRRPRLIVQALLTALCISLIFVFAGKALFRFLGITEADFLIAGGLVLLILAIGDLVTNTDGEPGRDPGPDVGVVPIGIPLVMGPAALTTLLIIQEQHGATITLFALVANLLVTGLVFSGSKYLNRVLGPAGSKAFAKVSALFLSAIAIMMIRKGLQFFFSQG